MRLKLTHTPHRQQPAAQQRHNDKRLWLCRRIRTGTNEKIGLCLLQNFPFCRVLRRNFPSATFANILATSWRRLLNFLPFRTCSCKLFIYILNVIEYDLFKLANRHTHTHTGTHNYTNLRQTLRICVRFVLRNVGRGMQCRCVYQRTSAQVESNKFGTNCYTNNHTFPGNPKNKQTHLPQPPPPTTLRTRKAVKQSSIH